MSLDSIENVCLFVSDALRRDYLPESVAKMGVTFKTVAQSTFSAPSFATLATGRYPQEHGVMSFQESIGKDAPSVFNIPGVDSTFYQYLPGSRPPLDDPIFDVLARQEKRQLSELESPFIYVEREFAPHFPHADYDNVRGYLESRGTDWDRIRSEYEESVDTSMNVLEERMTTLEAMGVIDSTLVILTSDHGELLGEYGELAHGTPMTPELVYVPTVFIHPSISEQDFVPDPATEVVEHVDVVETMLASSGNGSFPTSGVDLLRSPRPRKPGYSYVSYPLGRSIAFLPFKRRFFDYPKWNVSRYTASGAFWRDGGYVFAEDPLVRHALWGIYRTFRGSKRRNLRPNWRSVLRQYFRGTHEYGTPPMSRGQARTVTQELSSSFKADEAEKFDLSHSAEARLRDLGYR